MGQETSSKFGNSILGRYPTDLGFITLGTAALYLGVSGMEGGSLRLLVSLPLLTFLPGYALVSVLFPTRARPARQSIEQALTRPRGIDSIERGALAFALSLVSVTVVVIALPVIGFSLTSSTVLTAICATTIALAQLAVVRRWLVPPSERYVVRLRSVVSPGTADLSSLTLVVSAAIALGLFLVAVTNPLAAGGYTELALYGYDDGGNRVVGDLPATVVPGESIEYSLSIENQEGSPIEYTVITQEQHLEGETVTDRIDLSHSTVHVRDGETRYLDRQLSLSAPRGEPVRIRFLLYAGDSPAVPTEHNADEDVYFFVTVAET